MLAMTLIYDLIELPNVQIFYQLINGNITMMQSNEIRIMHLKFFFLIFSVLNILRLLLKDVEPHTYTAKRTYFFS